MLWAYMGEIANEEKSYLCCITRTTYIYHARTDVHVFRGKHSRSLDPTFNSRNHSRINLLVYNYISVFYEEKIKAMAFAIAFIFIDLAFIVS